MSCAHLSACTDLADSRSPFLENEPAVFFFAEPVGYQRQQPVPYRQVAGFGHVSISWRSTQGSHSHLTRHRWS